MVHPLLSLHLHPRCKDIIIEFEKCHEENKVMKVFGVCNKLRAQLDKCLELEVCYNMNIMFNFLIIFGLLVHGSISTTNIKIQNNEFKMGRGKG